MMNQKQLTLLIFFTLLVLSIPSFSQIYDYNGSADAYRSTGYGEDTIFIFFAQNEDKTIASRHSTQDTSDFYWKRFNKETKSWDSLLVQKQASYSTLNMDSLYSRNLLDQSVEGLRAEILSQNDSLEVYNAWVVMDTMPDFGQIRVEENSCNNMTLYIQNPEFQSYEYYNLADTPVVSMTLRNERTDLRVKWEASADVEIFAPETPYFSGQVIKGRIGTPFGMPYKDSYYYLTLNNAFGNTWKDTTSEEIVAKAVKADFNVQKIMDDGPVKYSENEINEALLQVSFENKSQNADYYDWVGFNDSLNILRGRDSILWTSTEEIPMESEIEPYTPGKYPVRLTVSNDYGCVDSTTFYHIKVDSSNIDTTLIPNVFTPDGDNRNDYFVLPKKSNISGEGKRGVISMKWIEVTIINRSGQLVYRFEGNPDDWEGWDGKVRNSSRDAAEGVYLYVIKGKGYDGVMHEDKMYSGFLYLFR